MSFASLMACTSSSQGDGSGNVQCTKATCSINNRKAGQIEIGSLRFKKVKVESEVFGAEGAKESAEQETDTAIQVNLQNNGDRDALINEVQVEIKGRLNITNCPGGAGGGYVTTRYAVAVSPEARVPATFVANLRDGYDYSYIKAGKTDALTVSVGLDRYFSGQYPVLFELRIILVTGKGQSVRSDYAVIVASDGLAEIAEGQYRQWQDLGKPAGGKEPDSRNPVLECFAKQADKIDSFIRDQRIVSPTVLHMRDEFRKSRLFSVD
ncbi:MULTISPECIES: hypothetical protein [unclassified Streptomyces]|uniref:Lipoprotein n=1 Tax=Streptomyces sp. NBC_00060 TaxID=2975636 RepID=A0AAU2H4J1_9ACTN